MIKGASNSPSRASAAEDIKKVKDDAKNEEISQEPVITSGESSSDSFTNSNPLGFGSDDETPIVSSSGNAGDVEPTRAAAELEAPSPFSADNAEPVVDSDNATNEVVANSLQTIGGTATDIPENGKEAQDPSDDSVSVPTPISITPDERQAFIDAITNRENTPVDPVDDVPAENVPNTITETEPVVLPEPIEVKPAPVNFDENYYLSQNPDVAEAVASGDFVNGQQHFDEYGRYEARDPNEEFDTSYYLETYPDVADAGVNPLQHYQINGAVEGRRPNGNTGIEYEADEQAAADAAEANEEIINDQLTVIASQFGVEITGGGASSEVLTEVIQTLDGLPQHIIDAYLQSGSTVRLENGDLSETEGGAADGREAGSLPGFALVGGENGTTVVSEYGIENDNTHGSEDLLLHEFAHVLDTLGGNDTSANDFSNSTEFQALIADTEVDALIDSRLATGTFHNETASENFAELFAIYYSGVEVPDSVKNYFDSLVFVA